MRVNKYLLKIKVDNNKWIIINLAHGTVIKLDKEALETLYSSSQLFSQEKINALKEVGILVEDEFNELSFLKLKSCKTKLLEDIKVTFILTWACNFACKYCFENKNKNNLLGVSMSFRKIRYAFKFIEWYAPERKIKAELTGGEPLLMSNFPLVRNILVEVRKRSGDVSITTNGYTLQYYIPLLLEYSDIIEKIRVTLDGTKEIHDKRRPLQGNHSTFENIVNGIDLLLREGFDDIKLDIIIKLDQGNIDNFIDLLKFCEDKSWFGKVGIEVGIVGNYGNFVPFLNEIRTVKHLISILKENLELLRYISVGDEGRGMSITKSLLLTGKLPQVKIYNCGGFNPNDSITFSPDGYVYSCIGFAENKLLPIGKYYPTKQLFEENINRLLKRNIFNLTKCQECSLLPICAGGCPFRDLTPAQLKKLKKGELSLLDCVSCMHKDLIENEYGKLWIKFREYIKHKQKLEGGKR